MASRTLNHRALRAENDLVETIEKAASDSGDLIAKEIKVRKPRTRKAVGEKVAKVKAPTTARVRTRKLKVPPRMIARWAVCDGGLKRLAMFEYKDRAGADSKLAELQDQKKGTFVLQLVKEVYEPATPVEPAIAV
jgi:hypothetical protein